MRLLLISAYLGFFICYAQNIDDIIKGAVDAAIKDTPKTSTQQINTNFNRFLRNSQQSGAAGQQGTPGRTPGAPGGAPGAVAPQVLTTASGVPRRGSTRRANLFGRRRPIRQQDQPASRAATLVEKTAASVQNTSAQARSALNDNLKRGISDGVKGAEPELFIAKTISCNHFDKYRKPDGTCNNLFQTDMGAAGTPQSRFLSPEYGDPWNLGFYPRTRGKDGTPLPGPREISNAVFRSPSSPRSNKFNVAMTHFGQFIDHDVVATPIEIDTDGTDIECCNGNFPVIRSECFPFSTPPGEFLYTCMNFVRSAPTGTFPFYPGPRQQLNALTSWLDLSQVYGSSDEELSDLSTGNDGLLKEGSDGLPDNPDDDSCAETANSDCFIAGDHRNSEVPLLTVMHILFLREHNRIATELKSRHKGWNNDKILNEARKISTGVYQHIVYNEFLPALLGFDWSIAVGLMSQPQGHTNRYSSFLDGSTRNAFGAAAYRMGHSLVGNSVGASNSLFNEIRSKELRETFFNTETIRDSAQYGPTRIGRWMSSQYDRKMDRFLSKEVRDHLFQDTNNPLDALDLGALNIQRGRDHGLPGYNRFRQFCGRFPAAFWTNTQGGFVDHDSDTVAKLKSVYRNVDDVDLFVGALSERPESPDTAVGPTFRCLIAVQFLYYKYADRFFYEHFFPTTGFSLAQVNDIKRQTLARIYCRNLNIKNIQPKIFLNPDNTQEPTNRIDCMKFPDLKFDLY
ncbi:peroxidase-like protein [Mytilus californianus]|uniref:peroxidase-like protein n=1 Tax=Mytilus californianus TaxID=6549 RepID=UPI002246071C|nr:peroxidase-like protein [Mytilus californianus]